jgi:hypothetical protein
MMEDEAMMARSSRLHSIAKETMKGGLHSIQDCIVSERVRIMYARTHKGKDCIVSEKTEVRKLYSEEPIEGEEESISMMGNRRRMVLVNGWG